MGAHQGAHVLTTGNSRKNMIQSIEASLKRLKTDYVDIYWVHAADGMTPIDEIIRARPTESCCLWPKHVGSAFAAGRR